MRDPNVISACDVCLTGFITGVPDSGFDCSLGYCNGRIRMLTQAMPESEWEAMKPGEKLARIVPENEQVADI